MSSFKPILEKLDFYARKIVHAAYQVHSTLGPGLLESMYETAMAVELAELSFFCRDKLQYLWFTSGNPYKVDCGWIFGWMNR